MDWIEIDEARKLLRAEAAVCGECHGRLAALLARIRPSPQETSDEDLGSNVDVPTEIRGVLAYSLAEYLEPLIRNLLGAAEYQPAGSAQARTLPAGEPEEDRLDLSAAVDEVREGIRQRVIADWFTAHEDEEAPGGIRQPAGTPQEAELAVFKAWGGWWATWRKLDAPADAPEDQRWERLRIEEDPRKPGSLEYTDF